MPNFRITSSLSDLVDVNNVSFAQSQCQLGNLYSVVTGAQSVALGGFFVVQLTNTANSTKTLYAHQLMISVTGNTAVDIFRNATFAAAGTALTPRNLNWAANDASSISGKFLVQATDPTINGTPLISFVQTNAAPTVQNLPGSLIMPSSTSNRQLYFRMNCGALTTVSFCFSWVEL